MTAARRPATVDAHEVPSMRDDSHVGPAGVIAWPLRLALALAALTGAPPASAEVGLPTTITFDSSLARAEKRIELADTLPADWSGYEALVLEMRASSPSE